MRDTIFVVGPTAVGKSTFALDLALRHQGEIVNADAFQVYKGLDVLTAKPTPSEFRQVPHHLYGFVPPSEAYSVARYAADARACVAQIHGRGRRAIVVGGTGLYIKALTHEMTESPPPPPALRERLNAGALEDLVEELARIDPLSAGQIDLKNKRRVTRALEVYWTTGRPFSSYQGTWSLAKYQPGEAGYYLVRDRENLRSRIDLRVEEMFRAGAIKEVEALPGDLAGAAANVAIGVGEIRALLAGQMTYEACVDLIKTRSRQYAKRQMTWFRREKIFQAVNLDDPVRGTW